MRMQSGSSNLIRVEFCICPWRYCRDCGICHSDTWRNCIHAKGKAARLFNAGYSHGRVESGDEVKRPEREDRYDTDHRHDDPAVDWEAPERQAHVHEYEGSTKLAEFSGNVHNHRVAGITGEAFRIPGGHAHKVWTRTDFFDHFHYIQKYTGPAVYEDNGLAGRDMEDAPSNEPHVHFISGFTSVNDGHDHEFQFATLIDSPLLPEPEEEGNSHR